MVRNGVRVTAAMAAALSVAGCITQGGGTGDTRDLDTDEKKVISAAVGRVVSDPKSAKYHWARFPAGSGTGDVNYCAFVEARSPMAGQGGKQLYIAVVGTENGKVKSAVVGAIHGGSDAHVVRDLCKRYGLDPEQAV